MEETAVRGDHEAREQFWTEMIKIQKSTEQSQDGSGPDLSDVPPHLWGKQ